MNVTRTGIALCLALAAAGFVLLKEPPPDPVAVSAMAEADANQRFSLRIAGHDGGCLVTAQSSAQAKRPLSLHPSCVDLVPVLAGARWWLERADGSVAFVRDDDGVTAEFAVADGAAFESYAPQQPIMTLLSR